MSKAFECPGCGEVSMKYVETTKSAPFIETYECCCGQIMCVHVPTSAKALTQVAVVTHGYGKNISQTVHCPRCGEELEQEKQNMAAQAWDEEDVLDDIKEWG